MFVLGMIIGAIGWYLSVRLSGGLEPISSNLAFYSLQIFFSAGAFFLAYRKGSIFRLLKFIMGIYIGQSIYSIADGGAGNMEMVLSELSAIINICIFPLIIGIAGLITRNENNRKMLGK